MLQLFVIKIFYSRTSWRGAFVEWCCSGMAERGCILFSRVESSKRAFLVGSLADKEGIVEEGGAATMVMISFAAYLRCSVKVTDGKGMTVGRNSTVSKFLVLLDVKK